MGETRLFVIRVWRHASEFRASVRSVGDAEPLLFTAADRVAEFLRSASRATTDAPETFPGQEAPAR